jgi:hypothetical protein
MFTAIAERSTTKRQPSPRAQCRRVKGLGKYQKLILESLEESPRFTFELWKLCQRSGLAKAVQDGEESGDFSYSYPPFRLNIARALSALKARGLIQDRVLPGSTAWGNPIDRHWWYLADTDTTESIQRLADLNTIANINGQLVQLQWLAREKPWVIRHRLSIAALARLPRQIIT